MVRGRKQKRGDIVRINIGNGKQLLAVALTHPLFAFLDGVVESEEPVQDVRDRAVLFKLWVMDSAAKSGRWPIVGKVDPPTVSTLDGAVFFKQDRISGRISAYDALANAESPLSFEEADRLECAAVWSPEHVEDRLRDHLNGISNNWWASMRPRK
ncbi:Imm26 family immunity protein [Neorhizobium tomejilense]|uniref:Imm26 family immunity protein n=1 Tax=Neorhizobium tomejilense TaxID=2093828 RepID=UPI000CFA266E|nr:Imm26 family immunity protein [Neorhizobium tomejilense]